MVFWSIDVWWISMIAAIRHSVASISTAYHWKQELFDVTMYKYSIVKLWYWTLTGNLSKLLCDIFCGNEHNALLQNMNLNNDCLSG
jgi:hypothetical protein